MITEQRLREVVRQEIAPVKEDVELINKKLFIGNGQPSLQEQIAVTRGKLDSVSEDVTMLKSKSRVPSQKQGSRALWKGLGLVLLTLLTGLLSWWGVAPPQ